MKKLIVFCGALSLLLGSCSSDSSKTANQNSTAVLLKETLTGIDPVGTVNKYTIYDGNKIISIETPGQLQLDTFEYTGNLITKRLEYIYNALNYTCQYGYDSNGRLMTEITLDQMQNIGEKKLFTYNADGTVSYQTYTGDLVNQNDVSPYSGVIYLNSNKDIIREDVFQSGTLHQKTEYTYDTKNSKIKNVIGMDKIVDLLMEGKANNRLSLKRYDDSNTLIWEESYQYTYNTLGYPITLTEIVNTDTPTTVQYTY